MGLSKNNRFCSRQAKWTQDTKNIGYFYFTDKYVPQDEFIPDKKKMPQDYF